MLLSCVPCPNPCTRVLAAFAYLSPPYKSRTQRYLGVRLLIFNTAAAEGNRCQCVGDVSTAGGGRPLFIILRHSHKSTKTQHYDLYALSSARLSGDVSSRAAVSVFDDMSLPAGVKRAFASICPDAMPEWKTAAASGDADAADEAAN